MYLNEIQLQEEIKPICCSQVHDCELYAVSEFKIITY